MRKCSRCSCEYEEYGQRSNLCRECKRLYDKEYHNKRSEEAKRVKLLNQKNLIKVKRKFIFDYLSLNPCSICGESDPLVLEFDHIYPESKSNNVSNMVSNSIKKIEEEINKCRVLCANCHRRHTAEQQGWYNF